jgi:hypothetical protein
MAGLASLAKFQGQYDSFQLLKQSYNLKWSSGQESLQSFNRFFNPELSLESMLQQIAKMISKTLYHGPDNQILLSYRPETY